MLTELLSKSSASGSNYKLFTMVLDRNESTACFSSNNCLGGIFPYAY